MQWSVCLGILFLVVPTQIAAESVKGCNLTDIPEALPIFISNIINLFKIVIPILLIIMGMFDFIRAVMSNDEKQMKEAQSRFIRRIIAAVLVFFVVAIVQFVFDVVGSDNENVVGCIDCFVNGDCQTREQKIDACKLQSYDACAADCLKTTKKGTQAYSMCIQACTSESYNTCESRYQTKEQRMKACRNQAYTTCETSCKQTNAQGTQGYGMCIQACTTDEYKQCEN